MDVLKEVELIDGLEAWKNSTPGRVIVTKYGVDGSRRSEMISSGRVIHLTPEERKLNQELAANDELDVFLNGVLQPVRLLEDDESSRRMADHPNHLTDAEAVKLFKGSTDAFVERLSLITNATAVERLLSLAEDPKIKASFQQHKLIKERLEAVSEAEIMHVRGSAPARDGRPEVQLERENIPNAVTPR